MEQFRKEYVKAHLAELDPEEVLSIFAPEEVLSRFDPEDRLKGLDPKEIEAYLKKLKKQKGH